MSHAILRVRLGVIAASLFTCIGLVAAPSFAAAGTAQATAGRSAAGTHHRHPAARHRRKPRHPRLSRHNEQVRKVLHEAARQRGKPYVYGSAGPHSFDCSGLVRYVFLHAVDRVLPHNAAAQYHALRHISRRSLRPGDLVFVDNGGYISHVGIFDGHHHWWVAPHTGTRVQRQRIYHAHFVYARVLVYDRSPDALRRHERRLQQHHLNGEHHRAHHHRRHHRRHHRAAHA
jgi:cell wall-associated NlpC family hydrolase